MIESAELLEHFQWSQRVREIGEAHELDREAIGQEIADIAIFLVELCRDMDYDLEQLVRSKLLTAAERYPIDYRSPEKGDHAAYRAAKEQDRRMY
jgi:NTP pyrophosphatase (non-canonical NTP hydrolase)